MASRPLLPDLEAALGAGTAAVRETVTPFVGAGRYLYRGGEGGAADAMGWAKQMMGPLSYEPSPEGQQVQQDIAQALMGGAETLYDASGLDSIANTGYVQGIKEKAGEVWGGISDDVKAGAEMLLAGLDIIPQIGLAGFIPAMIRGRKGAALTSSDWTPDMGPYLQRGDKPNQYVVPGREEVARTSNVDLRNPLVANLDTGDKKPDKWAFEIADAFEEGNLNEAAIAAEGHDGIIVKRPGGKVDFKLLNPDQINNRRAQEALVDAQVQREAQDAIDAGLASSIDIGARRALNLKSNANSMKNNPYWHPASTTRMKVPYEDLEATLIDTPGATPLLDPKVVSPKDQVGQWSVGSAWDRSDKGKTVTHVNGQKLSKPVDLEGGFKYPLDPGKGAGASGQSVVSAIMNRAKATGDPVVNIVPFTLGHQGANFSTMVTDVHRARRKHFPVSDEAVEAFDESMRNGAGKTVKDWPGYNDPDVDKFLAENPDARTVFLQRQQMAGFKKMGFPDVESSIKAVTDPDMGDMPDLHGGRVIGKIDTTQDMRPVPGGHRSYAWDVPEAGPAVKYDRDYPARTMFPDWAAMREMTGGEGGDMRSFQMSYPVQEMTPELAEVLMIHPGYQGGPR